MPRRNKAAEARAKLATKKLHEEKEREEAHKAELREKYGVEDEQPDPKKARRVAAMRAAISAGQPARSAAQAGAGADSQESARIEKPVLEEIPVLSFRKLDPLYSAFLSGATTAGAGASDAQDASGAVDPSDSENSEEELANFIEEADPASHSTYGYIFQAPYAPGSEPCTGPNDPAYPKLYAADFLRDPTVVQRSRVPIIIFRTSREFRDFNAKTKLARDEEAARHIAESIEKAAAVGGDVRLLPNNQLLVYSPKLEKASQEAASSKIRGARVDTSHLSATKMCLVFLGLLLAVGLVVGGLMFTMSKFFPKYFGFGGDAAVNPEQKKLRALEVLGLSGDATEDDVKRQYRKLAVQYHPDRNPNCADCETKFIEIADAYKMVSSIMDGGTGSTEAKGNAVDYDRLYTVRPMRMR